MDCEFGLAEIYNKLVWDAKHSEKFRVLAAACGNKGEKYGNLDNMDKTGSINVSDAAFLYDTVLTNKYQSILDIGTWFGTSAVIMAMAMKDAGVDGRVYTCDMHDVYFHTNEYADRIEYHNEMSNRFLGRLVERGVKIDFAFIDAKMRPHDPKRIFRLMSKMVFAVHDWEYGGQKGRCNYKYVKECDTKRKYKMIRPTIQIAYFEERV